MKSFLMMITIISCAFAGSTTVRIYQQSVAALSTLQNKQIGVNSTADSLGYKMWGGKDAAGGITQWLAKDKNARVLKLNCDSSYSNIDTAKQYRGPLALLDSAKITGLNSTRFYYGISKGDSAYSYKDTSKIMKTDSANVSGIIICKDIKIPDSTRGIILRATNGTTRKNWRIQIDSTGAISADSTGLN